jgi:hypothetical protein
MAVVAQIRSRSRSTEDRSMGYAGDPEAGKGSIAARGPL